MKRNSRKEKAARYAKIVVWSDEDGCFVGTCPGLMFGGVHGGDEAAVYAELCTAVEGVIGLKEREGRRLPPPTAPTRSSGRVLLRLDPAVHQRLALQARGEGRSLNAFITGRLVSA